MEVTMDHMVMATVVTSYQIVDLGTGLVHNVTILTLLEDLSAIDVVPKKHANSMGNVENLENVQIPVIVEGAVDESIEMMTT